MEFTFVARYVSRKVSTCAFVSMVRWVVLDIVATVTVILVASSKPRTPYPAAQVLENKVRVFHPKLAI